MVKANLLLLFQAPLLNLQLLLDGVMIGAIFALAAYGLALVWGVMNVKNLAQGDFVIMGGYIAFELFRHGIHPIFGLPVAAAVMFVFGWLCYVTIIRRVIGKDLFTSLLATFGLALLIQQALNLAFGSEVQTADSGLDTLSLFGGQVTVAEVKLLALGCAALLAGGVVLFMKHSRMGQAIRATSQDARAARVLGVDTERVYAFTFALNAAICGAAGVLVAMIWVIQPYYGMTYSLRSFVIVTAAGLGNLPGVIATALGIGVIEQFAAFTLGAEFEIASVIAMLLLVLLWRELQSLRRRQALE